MVHSYLFSPTIPVSNLSFVKFGHARHGVSAKVENPVIINIPYLQGKREAC